MTCTCCVRFSLCFPSGRGALLLQKDIHPLILTSNVSYETTPKELQVHTKSNRPLVIIRISWLVCTKLRVAKVKDLQHPILSLYLTLCEDVGLSAQDVIRPEHTLSSHRPSLAAAFPCHRLEADNLDRPGKPGYWNCWSWSARTPLSVGMIPSPMLFWVICYAWC